jgi:signal transduction histidine kinase
MTHNSFVTHDCDPSLAARLRASRARLVATADGQRRELERSLHDGIQQDLIALAVKLQLARGLAPTEPGDAQALLDEIGTELRAALDGVRTLSETIYPSVLETRGLAEALRGSAAVSGISIRVVGDELGRYPEELEAAVYFCCWEVLESAAARARRPSVRIWHENGSLLFEVIDGGEGSSPADFDLPHVRDRVETLGGKFMIDRASAGGTRVTAAIPLPYEGPLSAR